MERLLSLKVAAAAVSGCNMSTAIANLFALRLRYHLTQVLCQSSQTEPRKATQGEYKQILSKSPHLKTAAVSAVFFDR